MEGILNFEQNLDVGLLDRVVGTLFTGAGDDQARAQKIITQFQDHPDAWQRADYIIENSTSSNTKFIALGIMEKLISTRWNALPREQCEGIKNYVVSIIIKASSEEGTMRKERMLLNKMNLLLVKILKQEWPRNWPSFIPDVVGASRTNVTLCENNMVILKLLSEEIFDFSADQMTTVKAKAMKTQLQGEFSEIFQLCTEVLEKAQKGSLIVATLEALLRFLRWIPLGYIFETSLVPTLTQRFLAVPAFRNAALKCITEVCGLEMQAEYRPAFVQIFTQAMDSLAGMLPMSSALDLNEAFRSSGAEEQRFLQNLALFFATSLGTHVRLFEAHVGQERLLLAHMYLLKLSLVEDREMFKVCLEYWARFVSDLYNEYPAALLLSQSGSRRVLYGEVLSNLRVVMIERMVKPEEVLVVEDENGEVVREYVKETDTLQLYSSMHEVLVFLTHLDYADTETIMTEKLSRQFDGSEWSWANLNRLCWAIGSISGAMNEEVEKHFLVNVIRDLLGLCELKRGKDNKAIIAANIMYVVGQYPRFLNAHWKFLKTVANKLFEFMHETHEGVQDMACDTFIKITKKCRRLFVAAQPGEAQPFLDDMLETMPRIICDLQPGQVHAFYEAMGQLVKALPDPAAQTQAVARLMALPNQSWDTIIAAAAQNPAVLQDVDTLKSLSNILRTNVAACRTAGPAFVSQVSRVYMDMLSLYRAVSGLISERIGAEGAGATKTLQVKAMRTVKKDILRLVEAFMADVPDPAAVTENFLPPLFDAILGDYQRNVEQAREAEVLTLTAAIIGQLDLTDMVRPILEAVFAPTLAMISKDFAEYPEHRAAFFRLLQAIIGHAFPALLLLPQGQFKLIVDSLVWAFKHTHHDISETGLRMCWDLLNSFAQADPAVANTFYQAFYLGLLQDVFYVLTDTDHKAGFKLQALILAHLFELASTPGRITVALFDQAHVQAADNTAFVASFVTGLLRTAFPHLQPAQIETFVRGCFDLNRDFAVFRPHLRDFLISLKEFSGDNQELYAEERELELDRKRQAELDAAKRVPGLLKPADRDALSD